MEAEDLMKLLRLIGCESYVHRAFPIAPTASKKVDCLDEIDSKQRLSDLTLE